MRRALRQMKPALSLWSAHLVSRLLLVLARKLGQRFVVRWRQRHRLLVLLRCIGLLLRLRRGELLWGASATAKSRFDSSELLRHHLELARERAQLSLHRIDSGCETGGVADALARIGGRAFLRQRYIRPSLHQRFERGDHRLNIGDLLLEPPDAVGRRRSGCGWGLRSCRRSLLRNRLLLLGKHRSSSDEGQKQGSCQNTR